MPSRMSPSLKLASRVRINENVLFQELQGEAVLLNLTSGVYFGLDQMGTRVWQLLGKQELLSDVAQSIMAEYDVSVECCVADLLSLTELESGIASLKAQINERNAEPSFLIELASRYALLRQHSAAVETLRAAIHRFPESEDVYYRLLRMLHKCGRDQEALLVGQRA